MESLNLSYSEVLYEIPYRNLIIMGKDKQHVIYDGEVMVEVNEDEFFKNRRNPLK